MESNKIYTKTGDGGDTSLLGGTRVRKDDARVEAYGTVDELNAHIGLLATMMEGLPTRDTHNVLAYSRHLTEIQPNLFVLQTLLANENEALASRLPQLPANATAQLEQWIDDMQQQIPPMVAFVIPGGTATAAQCHVARTVCRRAERRMVSLDALSPIDPALRQYLNRLSDYLFVLSRLLVRIENHEEVLWKSHEA